MAGCRTPPGGTGSATTQATLIRWGGRVGKTAGQRGPGRTVPGDWHPGVWPWLASSSPQRTPLRLQLGGGYGHTGSWAQGEGPGAISEGGHWPPIAAPGPAGWRGGRPPPTSAPPTADVEGAMPPAAVG